MISNFIAIIFFVLTIFWLSYFYIHDREKKEPIKLIFLGIAVSFGVVIICAIVESFAHGYIKQIMGISMLDLIKNKNELRAPKVLIGIIPEDLINATIEEIGKFLALYFVFYKRKNFNKISDGIFFGIVIGIGFAFFEDLGYLLDSGATAGIRALFILFHPTTIGIVGYFLAKHKILHTSKWQVVIALIGVSILHGIHNWLLLWGNEISIDLFLILSITLYCELFILFTHAQKLSPLYCVFCDKENHMFDRYCEHCGHELYAPSKK